MGLFSSIGAFSCAGRRSGSTTSQAAAPCREIARAGIRPRSGDTGTVPLAAPRQIRLAFPTPPSGRLRIFRKPAPGRARSPGKFGGNVRRIAEKRTFGRPASRRAPKPSSVLSSDGTERSVPSLGKAGVSPGLREAPSGRSPSPAFPSVPSGGIFLDAGAFRSGFGTRVPGAGTDTSNPGKPME